MGSRREGRIIAFQTLFRYDFTVEPIKRLLDFSWMGSEKVKELDPQVSSFAQLLITGTLQNLKEIDAKIGAFLEHWDFSRVSKVDLANLRISVFSLLYMQDVPSNVTIDEAVDIAKEFGTDDSYRFINGVLDSINKSLKK